MIFTDADGDADGDGPVALQREKLTQMGTAPLRCNVKTQLSYNMKRGRYWKKYRPFLANPFTLVYHQYSE